MPRRFTPDAPRPLRLLQAAAVVAAAGLAASDTLAQVIPGREIIRHPDGAYDEWSDDGPVYDAIWDRIDAARKPQHPDLIPADLIPEAVLNRLINHLSAGLLEQAEKESRLLVELCPTRPTAHYNHACVLAQRGKSDEALAALTRAVELGWRHREHMHVDTSLDPIRRDPRFGALMERIDALIDLERPRRKPLRTAEALNEIVGDLKNFIPETMRDHRIPGMSIALVRDGAVVWTESFGLIDERSADPLHDRTLFRVHAPMRLLISLQALWMHERGLWDLDQPLTRWLPSLKFSEVSAARDLTIRRALDFSGGIRWRPPGDILESLDAEIRESFLIAHDRIGRRYGYIPQSYLAVGRAIELAMAEAHRDDPTMAEHLDRPVSEHIRTAFISPLLMNRTLLQQPTEGRMVRATGHTEYGTPYREPLIIRRPDSPIFTTAKDLAELIAYLVDAGAYERGPLSPRTIEQLYRPGLAQTVDDGDLSYSFGLGVKVIETDLGPCVETGDVHQGVGSLLRWYPQAKCGVVILFNSDDGMNAARRIAQRALGGI